MAPIFDASFKRSEKTFPAIVDAFDGFLNAVEKNPRAVGQKHPNYDQGEFWLYESPPVSRIPNFAILYEIDDAEGVVILWRFFLLNN